MRLERGCCMDRHVYGRSLMVVIALGLVHIAPAVGAQTPATAQVARSVATDQAGLPALSPAVASLIRTSTAAYQQMHSYQHTAELVRRNEQDAVEQDQAFTLALERPNKFCYRSDDPNATAAVSNGKTYT